MRRTIFLLFPVLTIFYTLVFITSYFPPFGQVKSVASSRVSTYYIENAARETGSPNIVTGILADYRSFDTLMETTVIFIAGLGCVLILGLKRNHE